MKSTYQIILLAAGLEKQAAKACKQSEEIEAKIETIKYALDSMTAKQNEGQ